MGISALPTASPMIYIENAKKDWMIDAFNNTVINTILNIVSAMGFIAKELRSVEATPLISPNTIMNTIFFDLGIRKSQTVLKK
jgi:hypothetical protein